jgi:hypothetical protein
MRRGPWLPVVLAFGLLAGLGAVQTAGAQRQSVTVELTSQNNSAITGTATLTDAGGGKLHVEIRANGAGAGPQPAHIHEGTCTQLNPAPKFPLADVVNGASRTEVDGSLEVLMSTPHAIHMHKSPDELPVYVACADIRMASQPGTLPRSGEASSAAGMAIGLSGIGCALVTLGYGLWRRGRA